MTYVVNKPDGGQIYPVIEAGATDKSLEKIDVPEIKGLFIKYGVVLFRGFEFGQSELNNLTSQYCFSFIMNKQPNRQQVSGDGRTQSVNLGPVEFPLHPEMSQLPWRPDIAWFACASAPRNNGETILCDGTTIVENLSKDTRAYLATRSFLYKQKASRNECEYWTGISNLTVENLRNPSRKSPFIFTIENDVLFRTFITPVLYRPMFSNKQAFGSFLLFRRLLHKKMNNPTFEDGSIVPDELFDEINNVANSHAVAHQWMRNDILMVDNTRFMHGRRAIDVESERRIATQFGYASFRLDHEELETTQPWRRDPSVLGDIYST